MGFPQIKSSRPSSGEPKLRRIFHCFETLALALGVWQCPAEIVEMRDLLWNKAMRFCVASKEGPCELLSTVYF